MTVEEAIQTLITIDSGYSPNFVANGHIAIGMAIKALEQELTIEAYKQVCKERDIAIEQLHELGYEWGQKIESCEDAISRQAFLDTIDRFSDLGKRQLKEIVRDLPPVTPKQRWIPVSERLPEDRELVLFSTKTDGVFEGDYFDDGTDCRWYSFRDEIFVRNNVVTAWMPLPEPYKC